MGVMVQIGRHKWEFISVRGRQFLKGEGEAEYTEYGCLRDNGTKRVKITDTLDSAERLALAAEETVLILQSEQREQESAAANVRLTFDGDNYRCGCGKCYGWKSDAWAIRHLSRVHKIDHEAARKIINAAHGAWMVEHPEGRSGKAVRK